MSLFTLRMYHFALSMRANYLHYFIYMIEADKKLCLDINSYKQRYYVIELQIKY